MNKHELPDDLGVGIDGSRYKWGTLYSDSADYSFSFYAFFYESNIDFIDRVIQKAHREQNSDYISVLYREIGGPVLDLMAYGSIFPQLRCTGCAVALSDKRRELEREYEPLKFIQGDINSDESWTEIQNYLHEHNFEGFKIILCRPLGGRNNIKNFNSFLRNATGLLSPGGVFLTQVPYMSNNTIYALKDPMQQFAETTSTHIVHFAYDRFMMIVKVESGAGYFRS